MSDQVVLNCCRNCVKGVLGVPSTNSEYWSVMCVDSNCTCHKLDALTKALEAKAKESKYELKQMCSAHGVPFPSDEKCPKCKPTGWKARESVGVTIVDESKSIAEGRHMWHPSMRAVEVHPSAQRVRFHRAPGSIYKDSGPWLACRVIECAEWEHAEFLQISSEPAR